MAVVGLLIIAIGAVCPLVLFRLLAFVEPGTASGAALRQSWSDAGGMSGCCSAAAQSSGGSVGGDPAAAGRPLRRRDRRRVRPAVGRMAAGDRARSGRACGAVMRVSGTGPPTSAADVLGQAGVGSPQLRA